MMQWPSFPLGTAIELAYGKSLPKGSRTEGGNIPVYGSNGITGWHDTAVVDGPTVIVGRKGSAGAVQFVDGPCFPIDTTYYARPREGFDFDTKFLFYLLRQLDLSRLKTATGVPGLTREDAYKEQILVPPLPEQRRIVDILSRAEGIVSLHREALAKTRELIPALFLDLFGDPATNPKGWPVKTLGELISVGPQNGLYKHVSAYGEGAPIVRIDAFYDGRLSGLGTLRRLSVTDEEIARYGLREGDILINRVNSPEYLGKSAVVPALAEPVVFESNMMRLAVDEKSVRPGYLIQHLQTGHIKTLILSKAKHAINQSSINQQDVKSFPVPIPPLPLQDAFSARVAEIESIQSQTTTALAAAEATFQSLLHRAFEIVPDMTGKPAAALTVNT